MSAACTINIPGPRVRKEADQRPKVTVTLNEKTIRQGLTQLEAIAFERMAKAAGKPKSENAFHLLCDEELGRRKNVEKEKPPSDVEKESALTKNKLEAALEQAMKELSIETDLVVSGVVGAIGWGVSAIRHASYPFGVGFGVAVIGLVLSMMVHAVVSGSREPKKLAKFAKDNGNVSAVLDVAKRIVDEAMKEAA